jgi:uncharacterized protein
MTLSLFAVLRTRGEGWDRGKPLEAQSEWDAHARFMDDLHRRGIVVLAGPLEAAGRALVIVRARDEADVRARFAEDPWTRNGLLDVTRVDAWTLRLGSLG